MLSLLRAFFCPDRKRKVIAVKEYTTDPSKIRHKFRASVSTMFMCTRQIFDGGILCVTAEHLVRLVQFVLLVLIWKALAAGGADLGGMTSSGLLTYTLMSSVLRPQLNIISPATSALWEGSIINRYTRPIPVVVSFIVETIGRFWIPVLLFYGLPLWLLSPFMGINPLPSDAYCGVMALLSLSASASLGFALDLMFAAFAMRLKNGCWAVTRIREAIYSLLSGEMIPFALFPWGMGKILALTPFGSVAHAPLSIYIGLANYPWRLIGLQLFWNVALWILAVYVFKKSEERMISFGG